MSKYTVELRWIIENELSNMGYPAKLDLAHWPELYQYLGLDDYPIFDEQYRVTLNNKILRHFYVREIGFETWYLFRHYLKTRMHEIMPYYNQLYLSEKLTFDPLSTRDLTYTDKWTVDNTRDTDEDWSRKENGNVDSTGTTKDSEVFQDTPMDLLDEPHPNPVEALDYATTVTYDNGESTAKQTTANTSNGSNNVDESKKEVGDRVKTEKGFARPGAEMLLKYRETFLNIDMMIINDLETLFMGIG